MNARSKSLRSLRKARHGWFDYEVLDHFGDELGPFGLVVYMVLARWCFGGTRVCMSLRDMSVQARMGKDKVSQSLKKLVDVGLILEQKGKTSKSPSCFDLLDVKDLLAEMGIKPRSGSGPPPTVFVADSQRTASAAGAQDASHGVDDTQSPIVAGDAARASLFDGLGLGGLEPCAEPCGDDTNCLPHRQLVVTIEKTEPGGTTVVVEGQICLPQRTELSAPADALINKKEEIRKVQTPPTPVPGDGGGELILPIDNCTPDSAEFPASIAIAAHWVMQKLGLSKRRLQDTIGSALVLWCRNQDKSLQAAAQLAVANYTRYMADVPLLRWGPWGPARFFAEGHWANPSAWPYDQAKQRASSEASVGVLKQADPAESERRSRMAIVAYLKSVMARIERVGGFQVAMERLGGLLANAPQLDTDAIEKVLTDLEVELCEQVHAEATEDDLLAVRAELEKKFTPYKGRMTDAQIGKEISGRIAVELLYKRGLPRLSLFFMDSP